MQSWLFKIRHRHLQAIMNKGSKLQFHSPMSTAIITSIQDTASQLKEQDRIVFTYEDGNPDGSVEKIAGVLNEQGNVLGMMPLPERAVEEIIGGTDGLPLFRSILKNWSEKNVNHA